MLGKRTRPIMIGKLSELLVSGGRASAILDTIGSPRSPLDMNLKMQSSSSPKGLKSYDLGGVGLAIVVALDKSNYNNEGSEILPKHAVSVCTSPDNMNRYRSRPIPVHNEEKQHQDHHETDVPNSEDYTYVTYHIPNTKTITKVYHDGGEEGGNLRHGYKISNNNHNYFGVGRTTTTTTTTPPTQNLVVEGEASFPTSDFLSSCHFCRKKLHGKDIYMYRGEKGFCSSECRSRQIMIDERKEFCRSEASRSVELSSSPYTRDQMFSTGIIVL